MQIVGTTASDSALETGAPGAVWLAAGVSALGGLLFGYDWVVIGGAKPFYEAYFGLVAPVAQAWAVSCALIGCLVGAAVSGRIADRWGRRPALLLAAIIFALSSIGTALAPSIAAFVTWRIAGGLAIGMASGLSPLYIAEIAPAESRGRLVCLNQIAIVFGLLGAQIVNLLIAMPVARGATLAEIAQSWNGMTGWRWMFGAAAVPAVAFMIGCLFIPESPRWLSSKGKRERALKVLQRFTSAEEAATTLAEIDRTAVVERSRPLAAALRDARTRKILGIGVILAILQQWCGINVIFNYAQEIFAAAGYAVSDTLLNIVITGVVNCVFTLVALATVERWGRRSLMLLGCAGLAMIYAAIGASYFLGVQGWPLLILVVAAIAIYAMTLAPVTWVALAEIFPGDVRAEFMSIATTALWAACFVLTFTFPLLNEAAGTGATFWLYGVVCAAGFAFVWRSLPETRGKSLEQIERDW